MKEIGGYFELELNKLGEYHQDALALNSGRSCFSYILKVQKPSKVYLPYYICESIVESMRAERVRVEFYNIDANFEILTDVVLRHGEKLLYVNYFGLKSSYVEWLVEKYGEKLIVDNTQNFYEQPIENIDTFYSPRKFFGVSDGGYLYTNTQTNLSLELDESINFSMQLLGRWEKRADEYYMNYQEAECRLINQPISLMSNLTRAILNSIDYEATKHKRNENFAYLHSVLKGKNLLKFDLNCLDGMMVYPFVSKNIKLRESLISKKIYVATYWPEVNDRSGCDIEKKITDTLVSLPIDQRYEEKDMNNILTVLARYI